jgi:hypothetical protein
MIKDIHKLGLEFIKTLNKNDVFLDNSTGDYYYYNADTNLWVPSGNTGLHYVKAAESMGKVGSYLTKVQTYKANTHSVYTANIYKSKLTEAKCSIKKPYL